MFIGSRPVARLLSFVTADVMTVFSDFARRGLQKLGRPMPHQRCYVFTRWSGLRSVAVLDHAAASVEALARACVAGVLGCWGVVLDK